MTTTLSGHKAISEFIRVELVALLGEGNPVPQVARNTVYRWSHEFPDPMPVQRFDRGVDRRGRPTGWLSADPNAIREWLRRRFVHASARPAGTTGDTLANGGGIHPVKRLAPRDTVGH